MSRDLTPHQFYELEKYNIQQGHGSIMDMMEHMTITYNGETSPAYSPNSLEHRKQYPLLGRLYNRFDELYSALSQLNGGLEVLANHERELEAYIQTGAGDRNSALIRWFEGELDQSFYYSEHNDELFLSSVRDEIRDAHRIDPTQGNVLWFPLNEDMCISVWYSPDEEYGDELRMKLERRAEDGSMGAHCELLCDESFYTGKLTRDAIIETLEDVRDTADHILNLESEAEQNDSGDNAPAILDETIQSVTDQIMSAFGLKQPALDDKLLDARQRAGEDKAAHQGNNHSFEAEK